MATISIASAKGWCAEVSDPASEKQRRLVHIARVEAARREEIAGVVEGHQHHYETPQQIDGIEPHPVRNYRRCVRAGGLYHRKAGRETMNVGIQAKSRVRR